MKRILLTTVAILIIGFCGCQEGRKKPEANNLPLVEVQIHRYETDLFSIPSDALQEGLKSLASRYPLFIGDQYSNPAGVMQMYAYLSDPVIVEAYLEVQKQFPDLVSTEKELSKAFRMIRYYFPAWKPPSLYSYISGFDIENGVFLSDSSLILPLDNYLGVHYTPYKQVKIPQYLIQRMRAEYLVPDVVRTIGMALSSPFPNDDNLVAQMIAAGKLLYFAESVLPDYPSHLLAGFTKEEYAWCIDNEQEIWGFFLGQDLLFTKDKLTLGKFMNEGPGTQGFPEGSPGRIGHFIGWQIVRSYAARHPETELKTMMENRELSRIFDESGYKPSKK